MDEPKDDQIIRLLLRHNEDRLSDLKKSLDELWNQFRGMREQNIEFQSKCPRNEINQIKKWIWGLIAGILLQAFSFFVNFLR